jgi:poly-gamma-glutamate capsule biosynthesis protein CapA/YwtB (metallophosphatase superfamily)
MELSGFGFLLTLSSLLFHKELTTETLILTGDVMLGRSVMSQSINKKNFNYPFLKVANELKKADVTAVNLENPIVVNCPTTNEGMIFCADSKMMSGLNFAGVDLVTLANNHTKNYGKNGLTQTEKYLKEAQIDFIGVDNLAIKTVNKTKFGFLGFDFVSDKPNDSDYELIRNSKKEVDVLVVMVHWGVEYMDKPTQTQKDMAKKIIEAGADVIAGSHPHWVQNMEYIEGKPVFYSLGNFVFDQPWSEPTKNGLAVKLYFKDKKLEKIKDMPVYIKNLGQPEWVNQNN